MKQYPSISKHVTNIPAYAFDKLDGSCIRTEWTRKTGFFKFGSRKRLLDREDQLLGEAIDLFKNKYEKDLHDAFVKLKALQMVAYLEYWSPNSFAGNHADEPHDITLFDVDMYKKGILPPKEFLNHFGHLDIPKLLYHGNINEPFVKSVKNSTLEGMSFEGVVCKAMNRNRIHMFKIKTLAWISKLKDKCGDNVNLFNELL